MGMDLRCLVFSSDEASAPLICQALAELGAEADHCPDAAAAIGRAASESFQIVIADWDEQPNAEYLLKAARARKPMERPLTLAIVSDDSTVPKALQAGANSVLRKPILLNQVRDTLETARSLLKAKHDSAANASSPHPAPAPSETAGGNEAHLRAGDFLTSARPTPSAQFDTESEIQKAMEPSTAPIDPLKELEPMAAAVTAEQPALQAPPPSPAPLNEPRGLQWYLNQKAASLPSAPSIPMPAPPPSAQPALMGYDQMAAHPDPAPSANPETSPAPQPQRDAVRVQKAEAELFSYITHGSDESAAESEPSSGPRFRLGTGAISFAGLLAFCAIVAAPQAPWHPSAVRLWEHGARSLHAWLNPQVVAPAQAPESHESFGRAGDEYKLPVPENIPDATTDPSQIRVVPVVDPTAKKPGNNGADQNSDAIGTPADSSQPTDAGVQPTASQSAPGPSTGAASPQSAMPTSSAPAPNSAAPAAALQKNPIVQVPANSSPGPQTTSSVSPRPTQPSNPPPQSTASPPIPSSLKTQMASTVPDASGNKAPETALPSIEPVAVPESAERAQLTAQSSIAYPDNAKGQQGTVILQLLIGRDGSVQDAKFLQGSLAFARAAIDGVQAWKFKPYLMNGRAVSVQTQLTLSFSPTK
jgi:TonB family protein